MLIPQKLDGHMIALIGKISNQIWNQHQWRREGGGAAPCQKKMTDFLRKLR